MMYINAYELFSLYISGGERAKQPNKQNNQQKAPEQTGNVSLDLCISPVCRQPMGTTGSPTPFQETLYLHNPGYRQWHIFETSSPESLASILTLSWSTGRWCTVVSFGQLMSHAQQFGLVNK